MSKFTVIYHKNCPDGFGAAFAAWAHFKEKGAKLPEFWAAGHGSEPPECTGHTVYLVDYCYPRSHLVTLCQRAKQVIVLDHHISAQQDVEGLDAELDNLELRFDMHYSGAVLSWQYFHPEQEGPQLLRYIQDRDLWQHHYPETEAIVSALMSWPFDFEKWQDYAFSESALQALLSDGQAITRYRQQQVRFYVKQARRVTLCGYNIPVVNCPSNLASEVLHELAQNHAFAMSYQDKSDKRACALRSAEDGIDVSKIAGNFGGGGHFHASGFRLDLPALEFPEQERAE